MRSLLSKILGSEQVILLIQQEIIPGRGNATAVELSKLNMCKNRIIVKQPVSVIMQCCYFSELPKLQLCITRILYYRHKAYFLEAF